MKKLTLGIATVGLMTSLTSFASDALFVSSHIFTQSDAVCDQMWGTPLPAGQVGKYPFALIGNLCLAPGGDSTNVPMDVYADINKPFPKHVATVFFNLDTNTINDVVNDADLAAAHSDDLSRRHFYRVCQDQDGFTLHLLYNNTNERNKYC